jgi:hypothetical protein
MIYASGEGVILDNVYAHMWYIITTSFGNNGGIFNRDSLAKEMTPAQLEKANRLGQEYVRMRYKVGRVRKSLNSTISSLTLKSL